MSAGPRRRRGAGLVAGALACALIALSGCGGGGATSTAAAHEGAVKRSRLVEKIGFVPLGEGRYRLGDCIAKTVLTSPAAIERRKKAGTKLIVDPTGTLGIETEGGARCVKVMEEAVGFLNVP